MSFPELVSVVIPTRNRRDRLIKAVESVRGQTGVRVQIVVVDDASSDDTQEALAALAREDERIVYVRNERPLGGGGARNAGAKVACGNYIAFLDDDDEWLPEKLQQQLIELKSSPSAVAASCSFMIHFDNGGQRLKSVRTPVERQALLRANLLGGASVCVVRRDIFDAVGGFDPKLRSGQDWDLWLKIHASGPIVVVDAPLVKYYLHQEGQITGNPKGEYLGRRLIHGRYRKEMAAAIRRYSVCELIFYRKVICATSHAYRLRGLVWLVAMARGADRLRFPWRALRYLRHGSFARGST